MYNKTMDNYEKYSYINNSRSAYHRTHDRTYHIHPVLIHHRGYLFLNPYLIDNDEYIHLESVVIHVFEYVFANWYFVNVPNKDINTLKLEHAKTSNKGRIKK